MGADVGGTFTDVILLDDSGRMSVQKVLSTAPDYDRAAVEAIGDLLTSHERTDAAAVVRDIVHGTTVATNTVLERAGSRTALVTTAGFRDVLELRRIRMPHMYDPLWKKPSPIVERELRFADQRKDIS